MPITLTINTECAHDLFSELRILMAGGPKASPAAPVGKEFTEETVYQPSPIYVADADDEAEVSAEAVQGEGAVDSAGDAWDEAIHSPNKTTTKDGRWRLKKGAVRPEPTEKSEADKAFDNPHAGHTDEEDEFAAFTAAAAEPVVIPARTWTDADMSKLCNQAAQKLGGGEPVKKVIAEFVPEGEVPHSRNVPAERREEFAQAIEKAAGIEYAG